MVRHESESVGDFIAKNLLAVQENGKWGCINTKGEIVLPPRFESVGDFNTNGLAVIKENGKFGYINTKGEIVVSPTFESVGEFAPSLFRKTRRGLRVPQQSEKVDDLAAIFLLAFQKNGKWGYINTRGKVVIAPKFTRAWNLANGFGIIEEDGKYGYINAQGEMVIVSRFDEAKNFATSGVAQVKENGKEGYINAQGQTIAFVDQACGLEVLKNGHGEIIWPRLCPCETTNIDVPLLRD